MIIATGRTVLALAVIAALNACGRAPDATPAQAEHLPFDNSTGFLDGYSLRVTRDGSLLWNRLSVNETVFSDFLREFSAHDAGSLFVAFEPGIPPARAEWVRREVIASGLCKQQRCFEVGWDVKRPVVY